MKKHVLRHRDKLGEAFDRRLPLLYGRGWEKVAQICISHAFMIQDIDTSIGKFDMSGDDYQFMKRFVKNAVYDDYDRLVQLCDSLALPTGFCLLKNVLQM